jgi:1,2-diacylglycerol 3-beta-galactosyltransferase
MAGSRRRSSSPSSPYNAGISFDHQLLDALTMPQNRDTKIRPPKIVLLYSDTGGGHRSAADSIEQGLELAYADQVQVQKINAIGFLPAPFRDAENLYSFVTNHARWAQQVANQAFDKPWFRDVSRFSAWSQGHPEYELFQYHPADVYVSCQPHFNLFLPRALRRLRLKSKYVHVVTDLFNCIAFHFHPWVDRCLVPTKNAAQIAVRNGLEVEQVVLTGQPVAPDFGDRVQRSQTLLGSLGLRSDLPTVLLVAGGNGLRTLGEIGQALLESDLAIQVIAVCGRNLESKQMLKAVQTSKPHAILEFVPNLPELMGVSDLIITKAGPGTIAEASIAKLPIILFDAIPGHEESNVDYVLEQGLGAWCPKPSQLIEQLRAWLTHPEQLARIRDNAARVAEPQAALNIAKAIVQTL